MRIIFTNAVLLLLAGVHAAHGAERRSSESAPSVNSIGMKMVRIEPGTFMMGQERGVGWDRVKMLDRPSAEAWLDSTTHTDWDEIPVHKVHITKPFYISATEVTNAQYEQFAPEHKALRGKRGFSSGDDEAVIFVNWHEAVAFCQWLSKKEGKTYRLPTEAEWEYACRAGTTSSYSTGESLPKEMIEKQALRYSQEYDTKVSLRVGQYAPNPWGLFDMHGNVEEWCLDWYGPYEAGEQTDPVGRAAGMFRVARGGSHNTTPPYLRSANRMATLPEDRTALTGFRVVLGEMPKTQPLPALPAARFMQNVKQTPFDWPKSPDAQRPLFCEPVPFIVPPDTGFIGWHNHQPSITWAPNGDLLAVFFSTHRERTREMVVMGTRLRQGNAAWDPASIIFHAADRNVTGASIFHDGRGTIHLLNGLDEAQYWSKLAMVMRTSTDNGATWTAPRIISPEHQKRNQIIHGMIQTREGYLIQLCDAVPGQDGGSAVWLSKDNGATWTDLGAGQPIPSFAKGTTGAWVAGIHGRVVQRKDGGLLAFGRGDPIEGRLAMSISNDLGKTWTYYPSEFPPIRGGQRLVLMHLNEGPLLLVSFTDFRTDFPDPATALKEGGAKARFKLTKQSLAALAQTGLPADILSRLRSLEDEILVTDEEVAARLEKVLGKDGAARYHQQILASLDALPPRGMLIRDAAGKNRRVFGMFAALSCDDGRTWPVKKLITPGGEPRLLQTYGWVGNCYIDDTHAEIGGYLASTQTPDGVIHLISSGLHYRFNLAWLQEPMPAAP